MKKQTKILLLQNDQSLGFRLSNLLGLEGYFVHCASSQAEGLKAVKGSCFDICLLDMNLDGGMNFDTLTKLRMRSQLQIIVLSNAQREQVKITYLESGADDVINKPINERELLAKINAILRRELYAKQQYSTQDIHIGALALLRKSREVYFHKKPLPLTDTEYCLLELMTTNCGAIVSKEQISERVFKRSLEKYDRSIDMHLSNLRKKMSMSGCQQLIKTIRGSGYMMMTP
jgi:two-component system response regulator CpxR